jgi:menaquinone-9 beta-reductase
MRFKNPLIIGGGPAGSSAAIMLARGGAKPLILERQAVIGDALCGGFMSWHTLRSLSRLGVDPGGHPIDRVRVFAGTRRQRSFGAASARYDASPASAGGGCER